MVQGLASAGIKAEEWAAVASGIVGGKSGGKEPTRSGQGQNFADLSKAVAACEEWLTTKNVENLSL